MNDFAQMRARSAAAEDMDRILDLPRRAPLDLDGPKAEVMADYITARFAIPPRSGHVCNARCITRLMPVQAWALYEMAIEGGLVGNIAVGGGKTVINLLAALAVPNVRTAVLLVPPKLVVQLRAEYVRLREHFRVPSLICDAGSDIVPGMPVVHVVPYSRLSRPESTTLLQSLDADLFICDEAHKLRDVTTATTIRFLRTFAQRAGVRCVSYSGTLMKDKIGDFYHLAAFALGKKSPVPQTPSVARTWDLALDGRDDTVLQRLGGLPDIQDRLINTRGVIHTTSGSVDATLVMEERKCPPPKVINEALATLRLTYNRPDGERLVDGLQMHACARQMAAGFYYRWVFPRGEDPAVIRQWFSARQAWNSEVRERLKRSRPHLDSRLLCANAAIRAWDSDNKRAPGTLWHVEELPYWKAIAWPEWRDIRDAVEPQAEAVWLDDYLIRDIESWAHKNRGVIWYRHDAIATALRRIGMKVYGGGADEKEIAAEKGDESIACSIDAQGTGLDGLQYIFSAQLVAEQPDGPEWEQMLGRIHRKGQKADEVVTHIYRNTIELRTSLDNAIEKAIRVHGTWRANQKLLIANTSW